MENNESIGEIVLRITPDNIECETEFSLNDVIFWLEMAKFTILKDATVVQP